MISVLQSTHLVTIALHRIVRTPKKYSQKVCSRFTGSKERTNIIGEELITEFANVYFSK